MTFYLWLLGKIPCHTDHIYDFGGNIGGRQAIYMGFADTLLNYTNELIMFSVRSNTGETSGSSSPQRQREISMAMNPRENPRGGRILRETSGNLAYVGDIAPRIASVRSNSGETSGRSSLQRQKETSMATNPRENSRGDAFPERPLEG